MWPIAADRRLANWMHERNFYFSVDPPSETFREIIDKLQRGTELASPNGPQYLKLERRVGERIKFLTKRFTALHFLEYILGSSRRTERFEKLWASREEHVSLFSSLLSKARLGLELVGKVTTGPA